MFVILIKYYAYFIKIIRKNISTKLTFKLINVYLPKTIVTEKGSPLRALQQNAEW